MGCVNKSSKEFKALAARHNLADNTLELIVHKYWIENGNETLFPSDVYIQAQLGHTQYEEPGKHVRKLWSLRYSSPQEFSSYAELMSAYNEASRFFPKSAILWHRNANNNFVLSVKQPVAKTSHNKEQFFENYDNMKSDVKVPNLGVRENVAYNFSTLQGLYYKFNSNRTSKHLADKVFNIAKDLGLLVYFNDSLPFGKIGRYTNNNTITFKKSFFEGTSMNDMKAPVILHELLHAISMYALSDQTADWKRPEEIEFFRKEMNSLYQDLKNNPLLKGERGVVDVNEFVAELSNPVFCDKIKEIDKQNKKKKSFWSRVLDAFKALLGLHSSNSYYQRSMNALDKALNAFDIDSYMRYNGIKSQLREEVAGSTINQQNQRLDNKSTEQLNNALNTIDDAAKSGKWTPASLSTLDNLINDIENGKVTYQRFPQEASRGMYQGGRANEAASILLRGSKSSSGNVALSVSERYERDKRQQPIQERIVESWAKAKGIWHDNLDTVEGKKKLAEGGEAKVFYNDGDTNVIKILSTEYFITPQFALDRITLHNTLFPESALKITGFGRSSDGKFQFLVEQPFIQGTPATQEEIDKFITKVGFTKSTKDRGNTFVTDDLYVSDLHDENVIKTPKGNLVVIDADLRLNTPELNRGGKYEINNNIISSQSINNKQYDKAIKSAGELFLQVYRSLQEGEQKYRGENEGKANDGKSLRERSHEEAVRNESAASTDADMKQMFIKSMSPSQLKDETDLIKQESADYDLVNGIEPAQEHSRKPVPEYFTFNDGVKVKAPFHPNAQQIDALNVMSDFIKSNDTSMTLSGYAGTGKTSLMEIIAKKCQKQHKPVLFCASTNKAAAVLNERVSKAGFKATTLNKVFGINVEIDENSNTYNARNLVNVLRNVDIAPHTTVIIDEASMINEENYSILNNIAKKNGLKIIYVGDEAQLAPVNEDKISKVFRNGDGKVIRLTQVERTDDNAILKEATDLRNGEPLSGVSSFNDKGEGVAYIAPKHQDEINSVIAHYVQELKKDPNYFRILAYHNSAVAAYNSQVRQLLGYTSPAPQTGEPMTGYAQWGYDWKTKTYKFINSESYKVVRTYRPAKAQSPTLEDGSSVVMEYIPLTLENPMGETEIFPYMDIKNNQSNREAATRLAYEKRRLWGKVKRVSGTEAKTKIYKKINDIEQFLFVNDNIEDEKGNLLQGKVIDFGYAMTVHKSQGSTFTNVLMDDVDIARGDIAKRNNAKKVIDPGEVFDDGSNATLNSAEAVDLGNIDYNLSNQMTNQSNQTTNLRQQLEYVGVSRATDTVTIISNNVKKEGSPLHPKRDAASNNEQKSPETKSPEPLEPSRTSTQSIVPQLISHLKSQGINVLGRDAMQEFLKTHNLKYLQQAVAFGSSNPYENSKHRAKVPEILDVIKTNKYNNPGTDIVTLDSDNNKVLYLIDHSSDKELADNLKDGDGFGIRKVYNIDKLSENDIREITRNIAGDYQNSEELIRNRLQRFGITSENLPGIDIAAAIKRGIGNNGQVDAETRGFGKQANKNRGGLDSREDKGVLPLYTTSEGEVYGFVDKDGNIYLDETKISPEHPIHEYTHLWDRTVQKHNPQLWQRGVELMKKTTLWNEVLNADNYGKSWQSMNMPKEKFESLIASEVHARLVGEKGGKLLENIAKKQGSENIISKLKQWILDMWKEVKATFGYWSKEDLDQLTLKDFNHMTIRDLTESKSLDQLRATENSRTTSPSSTSTIQEKGTDSSEPLQSSSTSSTSSTSTLPEAQVQKVSLPGYEQFNNLHDETPVDAAWKIPYLKELDAQLSSRNSQEDNQNIINQMDKVLQATSKSEYLQEVKDSEKKQVDKTLDEYDKLIQQFDNLLEGRLFYEDRHGKLVEYILGGEESKELGLNDYLSASEIRHTAELIVNFISDEITRLQNEEGLAQKLYPTVNTKLDFKTATRRQIVEAIGVDNLLDRAKRRFSTKESHYNDFSIMSQANLITDNWDAMMTLASDIFAFNEGFGITKDFSNGHFTTADKTSVDYDNFNDYSNDPDFVAENGGKDEQEHWQVESRTIDVLNSMSALVRQGIHECYLLDADGNKVLSKWGIAERVNPRTAVNSLLRWTQGSMSLGDMVKKLSAKQKRNPWLSQLIKRLSDTSGKETDFQSQFYGVMQKAYQLYSIVQTEDGKYYSHLVNSHPALTETMNTITAQFKIGEHPLFGKDGRINAKLLGSEKTVGKDAGFNLHKAFSELQSVDKSLKYGKVLDDEMSKTVTANIMGVCRILGYNVTEEMLSDIVNAENVSSMTTYLFLMVRDLDEALADQRSGKVKVYDPFKFHGDNNIGGTLRNFLTPITDVLEDTAVSAFYDSGKMYQSYVTPSFMTKLFNKFHLEGQAFEDFITEEYGSSEWFRFDDEKNEIDIENGWRNEWLRRLVSDRDLRKMFNHKVELNFNKHNYMRNMSDTEYALSLITEYFSEDAGKHNDLAPSWYRVPMQSNKPSSEFIRFYSYRGMGYKKSIVNGLHSIFLQELSRIQTVMMRNMSKDNPGFIKNFDTNGRKFCFLPALNAYLLNDAVSISKRNILRNGDGSVSSDNSRFAGLLQKKVKGEEALSSGEETLLGKLADEIIYQSTEDRVQSILDSWEKNGILEAAKSIKGIYPKEFDNSKNKEEKESDAKAISSWVREQVENFLWNDSFASKNILQLTIGDIAFYKDAEDLQKRLAQLHAPGIRGRIDATDYEGNRVSDGKYRTFILQDFDSFISNIIANISEVFDRKIAAAPADQKAALTALKESLVGKDGKYRKINVTDAQGYSSPSSYRKKALIFGKWSRHAEELYQKLLKGEYSYTDLETAFQPLKPFVYTKLTKDLGVPDAPIHSMQVPFQAKNSEYLLIMADALLKGEKLSRPNLLRAVYRVMEDSEKFMPTKGIDTVQFESAIKSGLQGKMDIFQFHDMPGGEDAAYTYMMNQIFKEKIDSNTGEHIYNEYNTDTFVHEASYEDYCLQQEVPEHFKNHSQAHGSQIRMITPSDLDLYTTDEKGNQVDNYYEWDEPDGTHRRLKADDFRKEYEQTIADQIEDSINTLYAELHLDSEDKRERNIALSKILQREILSSPRYGVDLIQACAIDKKTGEFRIPKGDPIQAKRIEQLINSIIKNRVNKQKIAGGPIVQVTNFGASRQLHIRFNDRKGNLLPLEEEYVPSEHNGQSYKDYIKEHQGGIAYFEVFAPIWSNELFTKFSNPDGTINVDAINKVDPNLLKMVSYRIPTEDKYSCAPMKVVGFMPREAGDAIMLPYELTEIDDSDFDVDKRYVMRKDIPIKERNSDDYVDELEERGRSLYKQIMKEEPASGYVERVVDNLLRNPKKFNTDSPFRKALYAERQELAYYTAAPKSGRTYRDNKIVDMTYAVLTNQMTADKILNPGGFDAPKKMGYMVAAYKNPANGGVSWSALQNMSIDDLKKLSYTDKDLTFADTQIQFYKQNSAAASLIGVFAVNKVAHAVLEGNGIFLDVSGICGEDDFTIVGTTFGGRMLVDPRSDSEGTLIGKTLGSLVSASADAVKDPILNLMNVNMTTAGMLNTMLRLGMTFNDAALFLSQDIIERLLNQFNRENLSNYVSLDSLINKWLNTYRDKHDISDASNINTEPLSKEELIEGLKSTEHDAIDYKVLLAFQKLRGLTEAMRKPTYATRFNSISSAVGPLIIDNLIIEHKMSQFMDANTENGTGFYTADGTPVDINSVFSMHPVLEQFARTVGIAKSLFLDMPAGSNGFRGVLKRLPADTANKVYSDKKLLDQLSNFYQSYLLMQSGLVEPGNLKDYIVDFPKWFVKQNFKEKFPDNELIKAIRMNVSKGTGRPYLQINITGMDEQRKEELRSAWIDLHKADPELSKMLFDYSFFRAGIGFSPKTFMALVPTYVKERLRNDKTGASYVDTYRKFPSVNPDLVVDQFIRNNWTNNKLVPWRGGKDTHYSVNTRTGVLKVYRQEEIADLAGISYMKTKVGKETCLWHLQNPTTEGAPSPRELVFNMVEPLGNNGEYLEMSLSADKAPLNETSTVTNDDTVASAQESSADMTNVSPQESDAQESSSTKVITKTEEVKNLSTIADLIMMQNPKLDHATAEDMAEHKIKGREKLYRKFLQNVFKHKGLNLNENEAMEEFKKYC